MAPKLPCGERPLTTRVPHDHHLPIIFHTIQDGFGLDLNQRLSAALFRRASELGDAEAQGQMGLRYTLGLQDPAAWGQEGVLAFEEVRGGIGRAAFEWGERGEVMVQAVKR